MRHLLRTSAAAVMACALVGAARPAVDAGAPSPRRDRVVARIGPREVRVGEVEDRLAALAPAQRASFGVSPGEVRRRFVDDVVVRDEVLSLAAQARHVETEPPASDRVERALAAATIRAVGARVEPAKAIPFDDVRAYYERNRERYDSPERYLLWRILCKTRDEARAVLEAARRDPTPATFVALAREHSMDKATNLRGGNLGFLAADGSSKDPDLRVQPAVVRAAQSVHDDEIVPDPVPEGDFFAVVWRRATLPAVHVDVTQAAPQIRDVLRRERIKSETDRLVARLRAERVRDLDPSRLDEVDALLRAR